MEKFLSALAAAFLMATAVNARAETYSFDFTGYNGADPSQGITAKGVFTTSGTINQFGGYDIVGISGKIDGNDILGLDQKNHYYAAYDPDYSSVNFIYDNTLFANPAGVPISQALSSAGVSFFTALYDYNLGGTGDPAENAFLASISSTSTTPSVGAYQGDLLIARIISATPEPSSWILMLAGVFMIGAVLRRKSCGSMTLSPA